MSSEKLIVKNEKQFSEWFKSNYKKLGYEKIIRGDISRCPDFIMIKNGKEVGVELETLSSNFLAHKHDLNKVDEVLCLVKDVELGKPIIEVTDVEYRGKRKVTLSIEQEVYEEFQRYCEDNGLMLSRVVEKIMEKEMNKRGFKS